MNTRKTLCGIAAFAMLLTTLCACGKQQESTADSSEDLSIIGESETQETEAAETEETTEAETESTETTVESTSDTTETTTEAASETVPATDAQADHNDDSKSDSASPNDDNSKNDPAPTEAYTTDDEMTFVFNNMPIRVGDSAKAFVDVNKPNSYEGPAPSCYGNGEDINYFYDDFTIYVLNENDSYMVYSIDIAGAGVTTSRGITIGSSTDEVIGAYGSDYTEEAMDYVYTYGELSLRFTIVDGAVHYISYNKEL